MSVQLKRVGQGVGSSSPVCFVLFFLFYLIFLCVCVISKFDPRSPAVSARRHSCQVGSRRPVALLCIVRRGQEERTKKKKKKRGGKLGVFAH